MKYSELENGDELVSRLELREVMVQIHEEILAIHKDISDLREMIRNKWWVPLVIALVTMVGTTVASIIAAHWK